MSLFLKLKSGKYVSVEYNKLNNSIKLYDEWNEPMKLTLDEFNYIKEVLRIHLKTHHGIIAISQ